MHNPCTRAIKFKCLMEVPFLYSHAVVLAPLPWGHVAYNSYRSLHAHEHFKSLIYLLYTLEKRIFWLKKCIKINYNTYLIN